MLPIKKTTFKNTAELIERFIDIVEHYGFENILLQPSTPTSTQPLSPARSVALVLPQEKQLARALRQHIERNAHRTNTPTLLYHLPRRIQGAKHLSSELHVIGTHSTVAEMLLLATMATLLRQAGIEDFIIQINSLGDRDSKLRFIKDLQQYLQDFADQLPPYAKQQLKAKNPVRALRLLSEKHHPLADRAPNPMEYLNDESRTHLRDILEFMEFMDITYELDPLLVGSTECWRHTLFDIKIPDETEPSGYKSVARGGRYSTLARRLYNRRFDTVGVIFHYEVFGKTALPKKQNNKPANKQPRIFLSYISQRAKLQAFRVLESFYQAGIPIASAFAHESLSQQMKKATETGVPYVIIIGHKEALDNTAIVRDMETLSQKVIPLNRLPGYIARLKRIKNPS